LPARSLAQPRDSTRVVPAVPCCRSQPHCSSGSRGRDGKTAGEPPTSRRREQITPRGRRPGLWQQAAAGRRRHRAGLLRGVPARQARPPRPTGLRSHEARRAPANVGRCCVGGGHQLRSPTVCFAHLGASPRPRSPGGPSSGPRAIDRARMRKAAPARVGTPTPLAGGAWAKLRSAVTPAAQRSVRISVAGQFPPHLCVSHHQEGRGEPPAAVPRGDAAAPRGARHHSSCARPSVTSRLTQSLPRLPSAAASCSRTARPMDTAP
ncbi:unnamed protein product, partial [Prorocentrum cordatum]